MFQTIKKQVQDQFASMIKGQSVLFVTDLDKDVLWNTYINSFSDPIKKQEYTCNCCRSFIRNYGNIVAIKDNTLVTIWDFVSMDEHMDAVNNMRMLVTTSVVRDIFISDINRIGTDSNVQGFETTSEGKRVLLKNPILWNHFSLELPNMCVMSSSVGRLAESIDTKKGNARAEKDVFKRSLDELTLDSVETVLELINQNSLYKGDEHKGLLQSFLKHKKAYEKALNKNNYAWIHSYNAGALAKIRNTSIGNLLIAISEGKELDKAVEAYEKMVAPTNYKRPTALVTKRMIEDAEKAISELGYGDSLIRRFAVTEDVSVNNVLFVNRDAKKALGVFNEMKEDVAVNPKTLKKVEEIAIDDFIKNVLPTAKGIQLLLENGHLNNLCSLITAKNEAPILFKWNNPFSWCYTNAVTDSIKENVKAAGGKVDGALRFSIQWNDIDKSIIDLDAHAVEPNKTRIAYNTSYRKDRGDYRTSMSGQLDVDMINPIKTGVENIAWSDLSKMKEGVFTFSVHNFSGHKNFDGVRCEVEFNNELYEFAYNKPFTGFLDIAQVTYTKENGFSIKSLVEGKSSVNSKEKWGIGTQKFHKVSMIMNSPNFWDEQTIGNKHTFFMLEGAKNDENARGLFNEFLKPELDKNRKVFEVLGGKLKVEPADKQLSGVGFSSTQRNSVILKVEGKFDRLLKINF